MIILFFFFFFPLEENPASGSFAPISLLLGQLQLDLSHHAVHLLVERRRRRRRAVPSADGSLSHLPGVIHRPDGEGPHVADRPVDLVLVERFRRLVAHPNLFVDRPVDALCRAERFLDHALKAAERRGEHQRRNLQMNSLYGGSDQWTRS